jgi:putative heme-binding domain-containing protein
MASAAIRQANKQDMTALVRALLARKEDANDPVIPKLVWFAYEKVLTKNAEPELAWLGENAPGNPFITDRILPKVMRRLVATGQPEDLARCIQFTADVKDPTARRKALEGLAVALKDQVVDAPAGWAETQKTLLAANDPAVTELVNALAVSFRDPAALKRAFTAVRDVKLSPEQRAEALRIVVRLRHPEASQLVSTLLRQDPEPRVRAEAARQLAAFADVKIAAEVVRDWKSFPPAVRAELVNSLASRKEWAKALLIGLDAKRIDRAEVNDNAITRIQSFNDRELNRLIEKAWGRTRPTPAELNTLIEKMRGELSAGPASFARGKAVFENQCAKCHKFEGQGAEVGPQLDGAGRDIEYILANVIDPNRVIGSPYFQRIVTTLDGRVEQGLLAGEDERSISLKLEKGEVKRIARADLDGDVKVLEKSMMPEGLTAGMTAQDFRDLVRYLMAHPFLTAVTVNGEKAAVGVTGRIPLPQAEDTNAVVIEADVTATADVTTQLLLGGVGEFEVRLDGQPVGTAISKQPVPDQTALDVTVPKGTHRLTIGVKYKGKGAVYARFLDPDRRLRYPEGGK